MLQGRQPRPLLLSPRAGHSEFPDFRTSDTCCLPSQSLCRCCSIHRHSIPSSRSGRPSNCLPRLFPAFPEGSLVSRSSVLVEVGLCLCTSRGLPWRWSPGVVSLGSACGVSELVKLRLEYFPKVAACGRPNTLVPPRMTGLPGHGALRVPWRCDRLGLRALQRCPRDEGRDSHWLVPALPSTSTGMSTGMWGGASVPTTGCMTSGRWLPSLPFASVSPTSPC